MTVDSELVVGARVMLTRDVERYPHFIAPAGATGTIVSVAGEESDFAVRLDERLEGAETWENEVHWYAQDNGPAYDLCVLHEDVHEAAVAAMREQLARIAAECEYDEEGEGSVDNLIEYKNSVEDLAGQLLVERYERLHGPPPTVICIRDPDASNEFHIFGGAVQVIDIDLGHADLSDPDEFADWREGVLEQAEALVEDAAHVLREIVAGVAERHEHDDGRDDAEH